MNTEYKENYRKLALNYFTFKAGMYTQLPLAGIAGLRITALDDEQCKVTVPYKFLNKNPFNTTYWAVLGMAAEMASGALVQMYSHKSDPSVSMFVTACSGKFIKRAVGLTTFICQDGLLIASTIQNSIDTKTAQTIKSHVEGFDKDQNLLVAFDFEWSIKARSKK